MSNRIRYTLNEIQRNTYYQMPKFLLEGEFERLSNDARVLYSLLRDRHDLSVRNQWINEKGEVYLIFSRESMCDMLKLSDKTITKAMNDLKKHNLIDEQRRGQGKPNLIYLLTLESLDFPKNRKYYDSRNGEFTLQESENFRPNDTELNDTDLNELSKSKSKSDRTMTPTVDIYSVNGMGKDDPPPTDHAEPSAETQTQKNAPAVMPILSTYQQAEAQSKNSQSDFIIYERLLQDNIEIDCFQRGDRELVDNFIHVMLDVILTESPDTVKIGKEVKSRAIVKSVYLKLNHSHIDHAISQYKAQHHQITYKTAYLRTLLYNTYHEIDAHYTNQVRADGVVW